jgi:hypothetical protein
MKELLQNMAWCQLQGIPHLEFRIPKSKILSIFSLVYLDKGYHSNLIAEATIWQLKIVGMGC